MAITCTKNFNRSLESRLPLSQVKIDSQISIIYPEHMIVWSLMCTNMTSCIFTANKARNTLNPINMDAPSLSWQSVDFLSRASVRVETMMCANMTSYTLGKYEQKRPGHYKHIYPKEKGTIKTCESMVIFGQVTYISITTYPPTHIDMNS